MSRQSKGDAFQARATHASHRAEFHRLGLSVGIAIAAASLVSCKSPLQDYADSQSELTNEQITIDEQMVATLRSHERRIEALENASGTEAHRATTAQTGVVHDGPAPKGDAQ